MASTDAEDDLTPDPSNALLTVYPVYPTTSSRCIANQEAADLRDEIRRATSVGTDYVHLAAPLHPVNARILRENGFNLHEAHHKRDQPGIWTYLVTWGGFTPSRLPGYTIRPCAEHLPRAGARQKAKQPWHPCGDACQRV